VTVCYPSGKEAQAIGKADWAAFVAAIETVLFGTDVAAAGGGLDGPYRAAWNQLVALTAKDGPLMKTLGLLANNTRAVLGPAAAQRMAWRDGMVQLRNAATADGDRPMVRLLDALIGLLDAGGDPTGLGEGLGGAFLAAWQVALGG
jgi:hypothetical protein